MPVGFIDKQSVMILLALICLNAGKFFNQVIITCEIV